VKVERERENPGFCDKKGGNIVHSLPPEKTRQKNYRIKGAQSPKTRTRENVEKKGEKKRHGGKLTGMKEERQ